MRTSDNMKGTLADIASLVKDEFKTISTSYAILLVLVGGIFLYGLLYNYMYAPDLVRNAPVVVVDDSKTDLSREYIRLLNATPAPRRNLNHRRLPRLAEWRSVNGCTPGSSR